MFSSNCIYSIEFTFDCLSQGELQAKSVPNNGIAKPDTIMAVPSPKRDRLVMVIGKGTVKSISVAAAIPTNDVSQEQSLSPTLVAKSSSNEEPRQDLDEEELNAGINDEVCIFLNIYLYIVFFDFTIIFINLFFYRRVNRKITLLQNALTQHLTQHLKR